jgi:hypothetical protein
MQPVSFGRAKGREDEMTHKELLTELERMSNEERLQVIEVAARLLRHEVDKPSPQVGRGELEKQLREAADLMRDEYAAGGELTAFTALDAEDFHDA